MEEDELFSDEIEFKAGDMTVAEFKKIIRQAIQQAMREALKQAGTKKTKPATRTKEKRGGSTTYGASGGITFKG